MIAFTGDMLFGDQPVLFGFGFDSYWSKKKYEGIFDEVYPVLLKADAVVANFESIIRERKYFSTVSEWSMCCDKHIVQQLKKANIGIVSIANNHIFDFNEEGYENTLHHLQDAGIEVIGSKKHPFTKINDSGERVAIIAATYVGRYQKEKTNILYKLTKEEWKYLCEQCNDCDKIIAYVHWGNEYITQPTEEQITLANDILEAGVDCIVGHHPHILQDSYYIQNKPVIFSLGNFFSDYWQDRLRKTKILMYSSDKNEFKEAPCMIDERGIPHLVDDISMHKIYKTKIKISTKEEIAMQRGIARKETIVKILNNLPRYRHKVKYAKWVFGRVIYIVRYGRKEKENPNIIYEKYKG